MTRLKIKIQGEISLQLDGQELLQDCSPSGRRLLKALVENHHGRVVSFEDLDKELTVKGNARRGTASSALKSLLDIVWPWTDPGYRPVINTSYCLPDDVPEEEALLCLERLRKSQIRLRIKQDDPNVLVDAWINRKKERLPDSSYPFLLQLTSFIGMQQEIAEVKGLLKRTRLLTLTGSGGCGKTRLMLQAASEVLDEYRDGVRLVELAQHLDPALVSQAVGNALKIKEESGQPLLETIADHLKSSKLLLLLDNCEHLLDSCAELADRLLHSCPHVSILASSREVLNIGGEGQYRVPSLSTPDRREQHTVDTVTQCESAVLFIERAVSIAPKFRVTDANAPALASVCRRLDGIPLAIELAAARIQMLSLEEIDERLNECLPLLAGRSKTALARHQTLRATLDWSYRLLTSEEQMLLGRLSVFVGGWTLQAAETLWDGDVLDLVTGLVAKSLVEVATEGATTRYRLLETVRQYAAEKLQAGGEVTSAKSRHRDFFLALAEEAVLQLKGVEQRVWVERLEAEHDNLRTALAWCREETTGAEADLRLVGVMWRFWEMRGYFTEGRKHLRLALEREGAQARTSGRARALTGAGALACLQGDFTEARALHEEAVAMLHALGDCKEIGAALLCLGNVAFYQRDYDYARSVDQEALEAQRKLGDRWEIAAALHELGVVVSAQGDYPRAIALFEEALAIQSELGDRRRRAASLLSLANIALYQGNYTRARTLYEEALTIQRELGDRWNIALLILNLGGVADFEGDYARAHPLYEEALAAAREVGDRTIVAYALYGLGNIMLDQGDSIRARELYQKALETLRAMGDRGISVALVGLGDLTLQQGDPRQARKLYAEALTIQGESGNKRHLAGALEGMAGALAALGEMGKAVRLWGAVEFLRERIGAPIPQKKRESYDRQAGLVRASLQQDVFTVAWTDGRDMPLERAIACALEDEQRK